MMCCEASHEVLLAKEKKKKERGERISKVKPWALHLHL